MNILYIAYSCSPCRGSEARIGWKLPEAAAREHRVFVLTKEEHRQEIRQYQKAHPEPALTVFYGDISPVWKILLRGRAYSLRLNLWHRKVLPLAREICRREGIRIAHQITPVEFRSIGDYGRIPGVTFVCGPVGGGEEIPGHLCSLAGVHLPEEWLRRAVNGLARHRLQRRGILKRCPGLLFANPETRAFLRAEGGAACCPEVGIDPEEVTGKPETAENAGLTFLFAGRLIRRKGLRLLLAALKTLPTDRAWHCLVAGTGPEEGALKQYVRRHGLEHRVTFLGKVPWGQMEEIYRRSDVLVLPSLRETTGSVVLEAMARGLAVVLPRRFGGGVLAEEAFWWDTPEDLAAALLACLEHPEEAARLGRRAMDTAGKHTWDKLAARYTEFYRQLLVGEEENHEGTGIGGGAGL